MSYLVENLEAVPEVAKTFLADFAAARIFAFHGELGAGKTTFIKALCAELGVSDAMSSPSFALVNEYHDANGKPVYHFDLYRLRSPEEAFDIGLEEYLYSGNYCFVEWPERAEGLLPPETIHLLIKYAAEGRVIEVI